MNLASLFDYYECIDSSMVSIETLKKFVETDSSFKSFLICEWSMVSKVYCIWS
jgi:hypothetical protein